MINLRDFIRRPGPIRRALVVTAMLVVGLVSAAIWTGESVVTLRVPEGGSMPQAVIDSERTVHLVFFQGTMSSGNLLYVKRARTESDWPRPQRVNSQPHSVTGVGPVDGGRIALGQGNRLHVVWFHSDPLRIFYTRTDQDGTGFEPQRSLGAEDEQGVEAGPTVAADRAGNVFVFWHAGAVEDAHRAVYMTVSHDDGASFDPIRRVSPEAEGACACCSLDALIDGAGTVHVAYRGAGDNVRRGLRLLTSSDDGDTFSDQLIHPWHLGACPVSTTTMVQGPTGIKVAWETEGQVYLTDADPLHSIVSPTGTARYRRKNPSVAVNHRGETLLAWGDGPGFRSGGTLHWQVFDGRGRPTREHASGTDTIPSGSVPTAVARADGTFLVIF